MKNLIICPNCELKGTKSILGENEGGTFSILRFHKGYTHIVGNDFAVICGACGEKTYIRKENGTNSGNVEIQWFHQEFTVSQLGTIGI
jgi:hypothetical protein